MWRLQDRDAIVKGLKKQVQSTITMSGGNPQAKIMEPLLNQPTTAFEFAFKIRVRPRAWLGLGQHSCTVLYCTNACWRTSMSLAAGCRSGALLFAISTA
jgi:hypothetical protein